MKLNKCYSFFTIIFLSLALILTEQAIADDIEAKLPDDDNTSSFQIKNSMDDVLLTVQSGGKVGIGLTDPQSDLNILGGAWNLFDTEGDFKIGGPTNRLKMGIARGGLGAGTANILAQGVVNTLNLGSGEKYVITIKNDKVGIGTTNPIDKLEVEGSLTVDGAGGLGVVRIRQNDTMMWTFLTAEWIGDDFRLRNETTGIDVMTFDIETNNVGIGTTDPVESLHTTGKIRTDGISGIPGGLDVRVFENTLYYQTSSSSYKNNIMHLKDEFHKILRANPKSFVDKKHKFKEIGYIAEEFDQQGLYNLVIYEDDKPLAIKYDLVSLYILEVVKDQEEIIKIQQEKLKTQSNYNKVLEERLAKIEARLNDIQ